jgi:hypothetical protein
VGDVEVKRRLARALNTFLTLFRESCHSHKRDQACRTTLVFEGSRKARRGAQKTKTEGRPSTPTAPKCLRLATRRTVTVWIRTRGA